ncbi:isoform 2 of spartin [Acrodontium crateriforme]|uniref:Isoform 2 of spartin n=1 Tax=Acrodontium crateriforme TaxID=150365 RepID=A0AAQ3R846_9PEZI|nr:isoform 2 of spartin [Acrodontium crateriforme]
MAGHHDPKLLYAINNIKAYHIQDGQETCLTPSGPQTLSLLMVPTNSPFADLSTTIPQNEAPDEDFYLHLNLPPELDLPMPATTQIYHQPPTSYLIPRWDLGPDAGAFTRIEFPRIGHGTTQEDVDTFETILAQCTAFLERAKPPVPTRAGEKVVPYNPADYAPGGKHALSEKGGGQIVLVDEDDGSVIGELGGDARIFEDPSLKVGTKDPVEVQVSQDGRKIEVRPISEDYLKLAKHPAYKDSSIVQNAATASRLIVTGSSYIGNVLTSGAESFTQKTKPVNKPLEFTETTHSRVRKINTFTQSAAGLSAKTVGQASSIAQNMAAKLSGHSKTRPHKGYDEKGNPLEKDTYKPGLLNKSMIAFSTIADGIAYSGKTLITTGGAAASAVVGHRYGDEAGSIAANLAGGIKNVSLVYIDVTGVSRRAVIKSVAKGMVVGRVRGGGEVVVGGGDGGVVPQEDIRRAEERDKKSPGGPGATPGAGGFQPTSGEYQPVGFGNSAPPKYQEFGQKQ